MIGNLALKDQYRFSFSGLENSAAFFISGNLTLNTGIGNIYF